ncbi:MAG: phycobiliprotein lyase [Symploca sp. SIO3C6]|uniref:Chromophore lyase CpcS/CpeS n=1 Tax=Symploca sp. SIO1C4 TaxID=2607765 RepID=A0A6B3NLT3_9CYAN|nr:phycobiliprotein lyase [Symploca sp. SIO3C6]NER31895.1 phycobiliprotein lyase [Symploca sp. SIO1C4]NET05782.1 phycobiliprotein lyase [Symploca sp. SIO2B6]NET48436.1 phycobiliprotein lyase [Merismopedia sp. SIO2A8]
MDAMEFFELSAGKWRSQRTTHHLPFRRAESGESEITVGTLSADHPRVVEICQLHQVEPSLAAGGALVSWQGTMAWDKTDENHQDSTVMVLVPDLGNSQQGNLLREKGYAEIVPVSGRYLMDAQDGLVLLTEYETMSSEERFSFASQDLRMRTSTVKRFGGFSTASFCLETRIGSDIDNSLSVDVNPKQALDVQANRQSYSILGW